MRLLVYEKESPLFKDLIDCYKNKYRMDIGIIKIYFRKYNIKKWIIINNLIKRI